MSGSKESGYRVVYLKSTIEKLKDLAKRARQLDHGDEFYFLVQKLDQTLRSKPLALGEPYYTLRSAGLQVRTGNVENLFALYGVDARRRIVYVRDCVILGGIGFSELERP